MGIAERLKWARRLTGMSQRRLTEAAGLKSDGPVRHAESGHTDTLDSKSAVSLAAVLGCSVDWLLTGEGEAPTDEHLKSLRQPVADAGGDDDDAKGAA